MLRTLSFLVALFAVGGSAALAQRHDSSAPIDFSADHGELLDQSGRGSLWGNVVIKQGEMTLTAAKVVIAYNGKATSGSPQASRIDASGGITVTRPDQRAKASYGVYDVKGHTIIMLGGVTLTQGGNTVNGSRLTINLDTGRALIDGSGNVTTPGGTTTSGGRVTGRFSVPKRDQ